MSSIVSSGPSSEPLSAIAGRLADKIRARADQTEKDRCVPAATIAELKASGLLRALGAKRNGGLERSLAEYHTAILVLGAACPSTAWVASVLGVHALEIALMPAKLQDEIYGDDPDTLTSSSYLPTGTVELAPGGYRLSGRWKFSSGSDHASWVVLGGRLPGGTTGADNVNFYLPRSDYRVDDTWHVMGLSGSGSKDIVVDGAFVPEYRALVGSRRRDGSAPGLEVNRGPHFQTPFMAAFQLSLTSPVMGAARGALAEFLRQALLRVNLQRGTAVAVDEYVQLRLAEASGIIDAAELRVRRDLDEMTDAMTRGVALAYETRARYRFDFASAVHSCTTAVQQLMSVGGGNAIYTSNALQRYVRDTQAMSAHPVSGLATCSRIFAGALLGQPQSTFV